MFISPQVDIFIVAAIMSVVSQVMRRVLTNPDEMKTQQEEIKKKQEKIKELSKKNDKKSKNELEKLEKEVMETMSTMMKGTWKLMFFSSIVFFPTLWFLSSTYENVIIDLPFPIPWLGQQSFIEIYNQTSWIGWYVLCSLTMGLLLNGVINIITKKK